MSNWYQLDTALVLQRLDTDAARGLNAAEAGRRLAQFGPNELVERGLKNPWRILWEQFTATLVVILILAAGVSAFLGDYKDTLAIVAIVILNGVLGFSQEYRAERAMAALKKLAVPHVRVRRDGHLRAMSARALVRGDIVLLEAGDLVPADARLLESVNLRAQESALTGESVAVDKTTPTLGVTELPLGDRHNMLYMGTLVAYGRGTAVVTETGMQTELGRIATLIQTVEAEPTPMQRRLDQLGRSLALIALVIIGVVFLLGLLRGEDPALMLLTAVSLAVAAVPEGLPAVVTIALALGAQQMLKRNALIRKLPAVETLGSVTVICSDKTGTLTQNRMTVTVLDVANHRVDLSEQVRFDEPVLDTREPALTLEQGSAESLLLFGAALCNDAVLESDGDIAAVGDPTEGALVVAAARAGLWKPTLERQFPRVAELPFDSARKAMTTVHQIPDPAQASRDPSVGPWLAALGSAPYVAFTKGAVDKLLDTSTAVWVDGETHPMGEAWRARIQAANDQLAHKGMRVLGVALRPAASPQLDGHLEDLERELTFVGMLAMLDPARPEVTAAVARCQSAGIRTIMITGDHPLTAQHIARDLGISADGQIVTGQELSALSPDELAGVVDRRSVYARVSPEHKLNIVEALQAHGHIVAMTGDGVNDAPALKKADIGVAMGVIGTDVAKEAADMVLLDDNFATIVAAVEQGRVIYDNIRKFVKYLMASNSGEIWLMLLAPFAGMPLPLLPLQILWVNLVTDGLPALALSVEPAERDVMHRKPYHPQESIFARGMGWHIVWVGLLMGLLSLGLGYAYWRAGDEHWQTVVFTTITLSQMAHVMAIRSGRESLFRIGLLSNKALLGAVALTVLLQLAVVYVPWLQALFATRPMPPADLLASLAVSSLIFWAVEGEKWLGRRRAGGRSV